MPILPPRTGRWLATALLALFVAACSQTPPPAEPLRLGLALQPANALAMIAVERGYFAEEGITVEVASFPSGKRALHEGLLSGRVDVAVVADVPFAIAAVDGHPVVAVGTLFTTDDVNRLVARRDRGISAPGELRGKRIGTQRASAVHFFLHRFLAHHGIEEGAVELRYLMAEELSPALAAGEIDAFSMREPFVTTARELLGERATVFTAADLYRQSEVLVATESLIRDRPHLLVRLVRALIRAERYASRLPEEAAAITAAYLGVPRRKIDSLWPTIQLRVVLDHSLLSMLEEEARWAVDNGLTENRELPDFRRRLYRQALGEVDPTRVRIGR